MSKRGENIYLRKDGRYEGRCRLPSTTGKVRFAYVYGYKYREVREKLNQIRSQQGQSREQYGDGRFRSWSEHYLKDVLRPQVKATTYATYVNVMELRLLPEFGALKLNDITDVRVSRFYSRMLEEGLCPSTARASVRLLRAALSDACRKGYVTRVPECDYLRKTAAQPRVLTFAEQSTLTDVALASDALFCLIGLYAGLRVGEICALRWQDWSVEKSALSVHGTVCRISGQGLTIGMPKTENSVRSVPVPEFLAQQLNRHCQMKKCHPDQFIVGGKDSPTDPRTMQRHLDRLCSVANLEGVHMHTLRHSYATRMLEAGADVKTLSALMGHSSVRITMDRYCHTSADRMTYAASQLNQYISSCFSRQ